MNEQFSFERAERDLDLTLSMCNVQMNKDQELSLSQRCLLNDGNRFCCGPARLSVLLGCGYSLMQFCQLGDTRRTLFSSNIYLEDLPGRQTLINMTLECSLRAPD